MDLGLTGRVALVTAASRGLGRASALALGAEGMRVALAGRPSPALEQVREQIEAGPGQATVVPLDLSDPRAPATAVAEVERRWGGLHALVANGPGPAAGPFERITDAEWDQALEVNVSSMVRLTRAALPLMRRQKDGRIMYITTIGVRTAQPNMVLSNATRLAVLGLAKTLSLEVAPDNVLVNVIAPGPIETDRMVELIEETRLREGIDEDSARQSWLGEVPLKRMGAPGDVAAAVALLASPVFSYTTGAVIPVDGGKDRGY